MKCRKRNIGFASKHDRETGNPFIWLIVLSQVIFFALPPAAISQRYERCRPPRDLVFIIDQSGSMKLNDPHGLRWSVLEQLIQRLAETNVRDDRFLFIPFGSEADTRSYLTKAGKIRWFRLQEEKERQQLKSLLANWKRQEHSRWTNIFSAFNTFAERFYNQISGIRRNTADLHIFFVSDGRMDVGKLIKTKKGIFEDNQVRDRGRIPSLDRSLFELLKRYGRYWRIYSICIGSNNNVDEKRHSRVLQASLASEMHSGLPYPALGHTTPGQPYFLRINTNDHQKDLALFQEAVWNALDIGSAILYQGGLNENGIIFPSGKAAEFRFHFSMAKPVRADELLQKLKLSYRLNGDVLSARLKPDHPNSDKIERLYLDFSIDVEFLTQLQKGRIDSKKIGAWNLAIGDLPKDQAVVSLQIRERTGWHALIDSVRITPLPLARGIADRLSNAPQPCSATLWAHGRIYNECGEADPELERNLILVIDDHRSYGLNVRKEHKTSSRGSSYVSHIFYSWETFGNIDNDPSFVDNLGTTISLGFKITASSSHLDRNFGVQMPACAIYEPKGK